MQQSTTRTLVTVTIVALAAATTGLKAANDADAPTKAKLPLVVYDNSNAEVESPFTPSGWMGNTDAIQFDDAWAGAPHSGATCIKLTYNGVGKWAGIVWQSPADDWGDEPGGYNLTGAKKLTFWARGDKGGETVEVKMGIYPKSKPYSDTATATLGKIKLSSDWKAYSLDLSGKDLSRIKSGFVVSVTGHKDPVTIYLDDIQYE